MVAACRHVLPGGRTGCPVANWLPAGQTVCLSGGQTVCLGPNWLTKGQTGCTRARLAGPAWLEHSATAGAGGLSIKDRPLEPRDRKSVV